MNDVGAPSLSPAAQHCAGLCPNPARALSRRAALACGENMSVNDSTQVLPRRERAGERQGAVATQNGGVLRASQHKKHSVDLALNGVCSARLGRAKQLLQHVAALKQTTEGCCWALSPAKQGAGLRG